MVFLREQMAEEYDAQLLEVGGSWCTDASAGVHGNKQQRRQTQTNSAHWRF